MVQWKNLFLSQKGNKDTKSDTESEKQEEENRLEAGCRHDCYAYSPYGYAYTGQGYATYTPGVYSASGYANTPIVYSASGYANTPIVYSAATYANTPRVYPAAAYAKTPIVICGQCNQLAVNCICGHCKRQQTANIAQPQQPQQTVVQATPVTGEPTTPPSKSSTPTLISAQSVQKFKEIESNESLMPTHSAENKPSDTNVETNKTVRRARVVNPAPKAANGNVQQQSVNSRQVKAQARRKRCGCCLRLQKSVKDTEDDAEGEEQKEENRLDAGHCHRPSYGHHYGHSPGMVLSPGYGYSPYTYGSTAYSYSPMAICGRCGYSTASCICRQVVMGVQPQQVVMGVQTQQVVTAVQPQQVVTAVQPQQVVTAVQPQQVITPVQPQQVVIKADPVQVPLKPRASSPVVVSVKDVANLKPTESDECLTPAYSVESKPSYTIVESVEPVRSERVIVSTPQVANGYGQQQNVYNRRRRSFCGCCVSLELLSNHRKS
ncbi:hypothetical protein Ddc_07019 [Ditylenchus destructor]|nr:hypothetical protein Ddc_07019 [Ditylenchus destructor]